MHRSALSAVEELPPPGLRQALLPQADESLMEFCDMKVRRREEP